jgi:hypothetical protein
MKKILLILGILIQTVFAQTTTIRNAAQLANLTSNANAKLGSDIELPDSWTPIGNPFEGTFDGGGYVISGTGKLFEVIGENGVIKNLGVTDLYIAETNNGKIINSYAMVSLAETNNGEIINCYAVGDNTIEYMQSQRFVDSLNSIAHDNRANFWIYAEGEFPILSNELAYKIMFNKKNLYYAAGDYVKLTADTSGGRKFGYWSIYPFGAVRARRNIELIFTMPERDLIIWPILSRIRVNSSGVQIPIKETDDIIASANVANWAGSSAIIKAEPDENGAITITASGNASIKTDVSPYASKSDSISITYSTESEWRLYLDVPDSDGYFVVLEPTPSSQAKQSRFKRAGDVSIGSLTKTFSLSDFKDEHGEFMSETDKGNVASISFAKTGGVETEATISISSLNIHMSMLAISGITANEISASRKKDTFSINAEECGVNVKDMSIDVDIDSDAKWEFYAPLTNDYGDNEATIKVKALKDSSDYTLIINKPIPFLSIVKPRWNNTLTVINNPSNRPIDYDFSEINWYHNNDSIGTGQSYYVGSNNSQTGIYSVQITYDADHLLRSCKSGNIVLEDIQAESSRKPLKKEATLEIYDISGRRIVTPHGPHVIKNGKK